MDGTCICIILASVLDVDQRSYEERYVDIKNKDQNVVKLEPCNGKSKYCGTKVCTRVFNL